MPKDASAKTKIPKDEVERWIYSGLFVQSVQVLSTRRTPHAKFYLGCMIFLFSLSTIHIALAYAWAFITDRAQAGIYELFSLDNPLPVLYGPDGPAVVSRLGIAIKIRYTLANALADGIVLYRCYVIWGYNWRPVAVPAFSYACTIIGGILGIIPLSGTSERIATGACMATIFCTNVLASSLAESKHDHAERFKRSRTRLLVLGRPDVAITALFADDPDALDPNAWVYEDGFRGGSAVTTGLTIAEPKDTTDSSLRWGEYPAAIENRILATYLRSSRLHSSPLRKEELLTALLAGPEVPLYTMLLIVPPSPISSTHAFSSNVSSVLLTPHLREPDSALPSVAPNLTSTSASVSASQSKHHLRRAAPSHAHSDTDEEEDEDGPSDSGIAIALPPPSSSSSLSASSSPSVPDAPATARLPARRPQYVERGRTEHAIGHPTQTQTEAETGTHTNTHTHPSFPPLPRLHLVRALAPNLISASVSQAAEHAAAPLASLPKSDFRRRFRRGSRRCPPATPGSGLDRARAALFCFLVTCSPRRPPDHASAREAPALHRARPHRAHHRASHGDGYQHQHDQSPPLPFPFPAYSPSALRPGTPAARKQRTDAAKCFVRCWRAGSGDPYAKADVTPLEPGYLHDRRSSAADADDPRRQEHREQYDLPPPLPPRLTMHLRRPRTETETEKARAHYPFLGEYGYAHQNQKHVYAYRNVRGTAARCTSGGACVGGGGGGGCFGGGPGAAGVKLK
ncbi:hypothetical protein K438DRAFT_2016044 [Mycena galopus ATCC 62051]|nr:hypothetical protein K438DRAFT_2016044 [Mycena galopus ATCC 62051]